MNKYIKNIANALSEGEVGKAFEIRSSIAALDGVSEAEISEVVRQAIISYLKRGDIYNAREAESLFKMPKELVDETVRQAVMSSFRDGDMETITGLRDGLPIPQDMARELVDYCVSWGKPGYADCMKAVFA